MTQHWKQITMCLYRQIQHSTNAPPPLGTEFRQLVTAKVYIYAWFPPSDIETTQCTSFTQTTQEKYTSKYAENARKCTQKTQATSRVLRNIHGSIAYTFQTHIFKSKLVYSLPPMINYSFRYFFSFSKRQAQKPPPSQTCLCKRRVD